MRVEVRNNNIDGTMQDLKKKLQQDGLFNEMRRKEYHETKGEKGRRSKAAAIRREFKAKQKQFEELGF